MSACLARTESASYETASFGHAIPSRSIGPRSRMNHALPRRALPAGRRMSDSMVRMAQTQH